MIADFFGSRNVEALIALRSVAEREAEAPAAELPRLTLR
jgi:hypothetical protein